MRRRSALPDAIARYAAAYEQGGYAAAGPVAEEILAELSHRRYAADAAAQGLRARALYGLSQALEARGERHRVRVLVEEGLAACNLAEALGDAGVPLHRAMLRIAQADVHLGEGRADAALASLDAALEVARSDAARAQEARDDAAATAWAEARVNLHHARGWALAALARLAEAQAEYETALGIALERAPALAAVAMARLSLVQRQAADLDAADGSLRIAEALQAEAPHGAARAEVERQLASFALQMGRLEEAEAHLVRAEEEYGRDGAERMVAGLRTGRAEILRSRGRLDEAAAAATRAAADLRAAGDEEGVVEAMLVLGTVRLEQGRPDEAVALLTAAREVARRRGQVTEVLRLDLHLARAEVGRASLAAEPARQREALERAADLAVPAALAADALRAMFPAGAARERWALEVAGTTASTALLVLRFLGRADRALELVETMAASVSLDAATPFAPPPVGLTDARSPYAGSYALAAGGAGAGPVARDRPAPPPRVRAMPGAGPALEDAIRSAEDRYGLVVRAAETVDAW